MAKEPKMIYCKKCGTQFNKKCNRCPQCGKRNRKPFYLRGWFIVVVIVLLGTIFMKANRTPEKESDRTFSYSPLATTESKQEIPVIPVSTEPTNTQDSYTEESAEPTTIYTEPTFIETEPTTTPTEAVILINGMRPEFKEAMDAYEEFYDEYCDFMKKYQENPTDFTLLADYAKFLAKAEEMDRKFEKWDDSELNNAELKYYLDVNNRVMQKLVDVMN